MSIKPNQNSLYQHLLLAFCSGFGPRSYFKLTEAGFAFGEGDLISFIKENQANLKLNRNVLVQLSEKDLPLKNQVDRHLKWLAMDDSHHITFLSDAHYPALLKEIYDPAIVLFAKGQGKEHNLCWSKPKVAQVGSRNANLYGIENAKRFAQDFVQSGLVVVSGLAQGIDSASHQGALLGNNQATTIAVMGTGIEQIYPVQNTKLAEQIIEKGGILLSEYPLDAGALASHFPKRNRLINGLSLATVVIQADLKSGSLITAKVANDENREVFALPGPLNDPLHSGCHQLIRQGASLAENAQQVIEHLGLKVSQLSSGEKPHPNLIEQTDETEAILLKQLGFAPMEVEKLAQLNEMDLVELQSIVSAWELEGKITRLFDGRIVRQVNY